MSADDFRKDPRRAVTSTRVEDLPAEALKQALLADSSFMNFVFETLAHDFGKGASLKELGDGWLALLSELKSLHRDLFLAFARTRHVVEWRDDFQRYFGGDFSADVASEMPGYFDAETDADELM